MSFYLATTSIMGPPVPPWLEELCQRLSDNDPNLRTVDLTSSCRIDDVLARTFVKSMRENRTVHTLIVSFFNLVDDGAGELGNVLGENRVIQKLQLRDLRSSRELITMFNCLLSNTTVEELSIRHSEITLQGAESMAAVLRFHPRLQEFRLIDCQLQPGALARLCQGLQYNSTMERLYLINTEIGVDGAHIVASMLKDTKCGIRELYLCENNLGDEGVAVLTKGICENQTLRMLDLRSNFLSCEGAMSLQGLLVNNKVLMGLNLGNNNLRDAGVSALSRGLQHSSCRLQKLDLSENSITSTGANGLANMLYYNRSLRELNLGFNPLGDDGATSIAIALQRNRTLHWLSLRRCLITNAGAMAFANTLPNMSGLKELIMVKNSIDHTGTSALLEGLRRNMELEYLHVEEKISEPVNKEIVHWIRLNKAGRRIIRRQDVPITLWPNVYGRISADSDALFHFLSERPDVF
jgi:Ran GTPase-activating protein (RanGAP) involved in mRNA processing and transport